ncbi:MAG: hypothetical protein WD768_09535 [Phycisphaeraceae bacterium]
MKQVHAVSLFVGAIVGVMISAVVALVPASQAQTPPRNATADELRFQIVMGEKHCFLIDTRDGRVWQKSLVQGAIEDSQGFYSAKTK